MKKSYRFRLLWPSLLVVVFLLGLIAIAPPVLADRAALATLSPSICTPLGPPTGPTVIVSTVSALENAVNSASAGDTILLSDGVYNLNGVYLRIDTPNVTLRSNSGNRDGVVLDGNYITTEIIQIVASNVTIADLTLREAYNHPIHVMSSNNSDTLNTLIYNVYIIDPGEQAIKINPVPGGYYPDNGVIACSHIKLTDTGRPFIRNNCYTGGVDAHQALDWVIRDNLIEGFWCQSGLSEHGIHLWSGSRDTIVERNLLRDNARGVGFGLVTSGSGRTYPDDPCPEAGGSYVDHFGGIIQNNFVSAQDTDLFNSDYGFDCGICLWNACQAKALYNSVYTTNSASTFSAIEWRFTNTQAEIYNNLVNDTLRERDGATAIELGNLTTAQASWFVNASAGNLHLVSTATSAIDQAVPLITVTDDYDAEFRPSGAGPDIGADEYDGTPFDPTSFIHLPVLIRD